MSQYTASIQALYVAYFNRPADPAGLAFWETVVAGSGGKLAAVSADFARQPEYKDAYAGLNSDAILNKVYLNVFGRTIDTVGLNFWGPKLFAKEVSIDYIVLEVAKGATGSDLATYTNRTTASVAYTDALNADVNLRLAYSNAAAITSAKSFLNGITTDASLTAAIAPAALAANQAQMALTSAPVAATFTLTTGVDQGTAFTGTAGADNFVAISAGTGATTTNTLTAADVLDGGAGIDTLNITVTATDTTTLGAAQIKNIEIINVRSAVASQLATVDASSAVGATQVNSNAGAGDLTVTSLASGAAVGVIGNGTVVNGAVTFGYSTATAAATINLSGGTKAGTNITNTSATTTAATINSTGAANTIGIVDLSNAAQAITSLTVNAASDVTATLAADYAATAALTVTGAGKVNVGANGTFKTVDASANTGGLTMTIDTVTTSFKGSAGNDTITTATLATPAAGIIDAGAGTADTLVVAAAADVATAALRGSYTNFEVLSNATAAAIAADGFTGITSLITSATGAGFTAMTAAQAASINVTATQTTGATYALATDTGTSDVLGLVFKGALASTVENATALTVNGFETVNLTASSGGTSLFTTAGAAAATTTYDNFGFTAAVNLKAVNVAGANAAAVSVATLATVTSVDASANTAGVSITTGGQTGSLVVTGSGARDIIAIGAAGAGGLVSVNAGAGNDSISALQADIAVATINGGAGVDTLTVSDAGAVSINDNNFAGVTSIEKIAFAGSGLTFSVGGYANALATANAGVLDVTAAALTAAATIDATGLSVGNSLKLSLTNVDVAANATATGITLSQGADSITIVQAGATNTDTITIGGGVAALAATTVKTIDLSGVTVGGAVSVTTGAGADVIVAAGIAGTYTGGLGADTFTAGAAVDTFAMGTNGSVIGTSMDSITGYTLAADRLTFGAGTSLAAADATALVAGSNVNNSAGGLVTFATADNTLALKIIAIQADTQLDVAGTVAIFVDGGNSYLYYAGAAAGNADDQLIQLVGVTATSITAGATTIIA